MDAVHELLGVARKTLQSAQVDEIHPAFSHQTPEEVVQLLFELQVVRAQLQVRAQIRVKRWQE
jgi:hypothetical protein